MTQVHLTLRSSNRKVGPIPVSTTTAKTCPDACPFKKNSCYADGGPLAMHWRKVTDGERGADWYDFCAQIEALPNRQFWRHNQAGDLPGDGDTLNLLQLATLVDANKGKRGFTYTHKPLGNLTEQFAVRNANDLGFTINLSANNLAHADELADLNIGPVTVVLPADQITNTFTPARRPVVICPAVMHDDVSCATCKLCAVADRKVIVGFPAHGSSKRKAETIAKGE